MSRTLQDLKNSIENMIQEQGKDAPVAAWIYTQEDVFELDEEGNPIALFPAEIAKVLNEVEDGEYIHDKICECIDDEIRRLKIVAAK
jgi:uncharacterized protein Smg (DUF494 family)